MKRLLILVWAGLLAGCVTEGPRRTAPPQPPATAAVDKIVAATNWPEDSDGNGFPDQFLITIMLWDSRFEASSVEAKGEIEVHLFRTEPEKKIATWTFDSTALKEMRRNLSTGPGYIVRLSVLDHASDRMPRTSADLRVIYTPDGAGKPVLGRAGTVLLGRQGM